MPFDLGDTVRLAAECTDPDGNPATASAVALTVTLPDGTTETPAVATPASAGQYVHDFVSAVPGRHLVRWVWSDPACAYTDQFDVRPAAPPLIVSLADAKAHLNITSTREDAELRRMIETVTSGVEGFCGIVARRTFTEVRHLSSLGVRSVALRHTPVISVETPVDAVFDPDTGVVTGDYYGPTTFTYTAGREIVPSALTDAALIILQHIWRTQRGPARGGVAGSTDYSVTEPVQGFGYAIPNRALQLMEPFRLPPGVA
ncbi:phage head-tail connector protein [Streptomyces lycii]|uniref:Uncharacterized protein n=1 Tax=Streptomyces lycii TaxID=2654337 RepID=A0ABQ7FL03_9ACTN|nr:phage head-tail connector protein [Streptomyces lycii]KAF4408658.1 hypothetical protein GCU69_13250 [Streptomyces lycii]